LKLTSRDGSRFISRPLVVEGDHEVEAPAGDAAATFGDNHGERRIWPRDDRPFVRVRRDSTPVLTSSLRFTGRFHDSERADVLEVLAPLERHLARWAADEVDVQMSVLIDNVEWAYGYWPRFGLTCVDYPSQRRTVKHRGEVYAAIIHGER
jgi:hypothetical protein